MPFRIQEIIHQAFLQIGRSFATAVESTQQAQAPASDSSSPLPSADISALFRSFNLDLASPALRHFVGPIFGSSSETSEDPELLRLWSEAQERLRNLPQGGQEALPETTRAPVRQSLEQLVARYRHSPSQARHRAMGVLASAQLLLLDGHSDGLLASLREQQSRYPELRACSPIQELVAQLEQNQQRVAGHHIFRIAQSAVLLDLGERLPHTRWWNRSDIEARFNAWSQHYQAAIESGEGALAAFERLKSEFVAISPQIGPLMNRENLWESVGYIATRDFIGDMHLRIFDIAAHFRAAQPEISRYYYQGLLGTDQETEARFQMRLLPSGAEQFLLNLTPWTASSNRAFLMNAATVASFAAAGWIGIGVRGAISAHLTKSLVPLAASEFGLFGYGAATLGVQGASWLGGTVVSAAVLPVLTEGGDPIVQGTYGRAFSHGFTQMSLLHLGGMWTRLLSSPVAQGLASWGTAVAGMGAFELVTNPEMRRENLLTLLAYCVAQDGLARAGHGIGERSRSFAHRTIFDEAWQNQVGSRLEGFFQQQVVPYARQHRAALSASAVTFGLYLAAKNAIPDLHVMLEALIPVLGMATRGEGQNQYSLAEITEGLSQSNEERLKNAIENLQDPTIMERTIDPENASRILESLERHLESPELEIAEGSVSAIANLLRNPHLSRDHVQSLKRLLQSALGSEDPDIRMTALSEATVTFCGINLFDRLIFSARDLRQPIRDFLGDLRENPDDFGMEHAEIIQHLAARGLLQTSDFPMLARLRGMRSNLTVPEFLRLGFQELSFPAREGQSLAQLFQGNLSRILLARAGTLSTEGLHFVYGLLRNESIETTTRLDIAQRAMAILARTEDPQQIEIGIRQLAGSMTWMAPGELASTLAAFSNALREIDHPEVRNQWHRLHLSFFEGILISDVELPVQITRLELALDHGNGHEQYNEYFREILVSFADQSPNLANRLSAARALLALDGQAALPRLQQLITQCEDSETLHQFATSLFGNERLAEFWPSLQWGLFKHAVLRESPRFADFLVERMAERPATNNPGSPESNEENSNPYYRLIQHLSSRQDWQTIASLTSHWRDVLANNSSNSSFRRGLIPTLRAFIFSWDLLRGDVAFQSEEAISRSESLIDLVSEFAPREQLALLDSLLHRLNEAAQLIEPRVRNRILEILELIHFQTPLGEPFPWTMFAFLSEFRQSAESEDLVDRIRPILARQPPLILFPAGMRTPRRFD